jgi:hypothetical protein
MRRLEARPEMTSTIGASSISAKTKQWPAERFEDLVAQTLSLMRRPVHGERDALS